MSDIMFPEATPTRWLRWRRLPAELAFGAAYWCAFLLALEPGNALHAAAVGHSLSVGEEAGRIAGASVLGACAAPAVMFLARRYPLVGAQRWRNGAVQAASVAALTVGLIVVSCLLVRLIGAAGSGDVGGQLAANGLLVGFSLSGFAGLAHALGRPRGSARGPQAEAPRFLADVTVKTRGGLRVVPLAEVDWIEAQGNYLALHAGSGVHLVRATLARFEQQLDPERFMRIHRGALVATDRVRELRPLGGGDAELRLANGAWLRLSRSYRRRVQDRLQGAPQ